MHVLASCIVLCCLAASPALAAAVVGSAPAAVGAYADRVLRKLTDTWAFPASSPEQWAHIRVHIDPSGAITYCASADRKEGELTRTACAALLDMGRLPKGPEELHTYDLYFNLWRGGMGVSGTATAKGALPPDPVADSTGINPSAATAAGTGALAHSGGQPPAATATTPAATPSPSGATTSSGAAPVDLPADAAGMHGAGIVPSPATASDIGAPLGSPATPAPDTTATPPYDNVTPAPPVAPIAPVAPPRPQPVVDATNMYVHDAMQRIQRYITLPDNLAPGTYTLKYIVRVDNSGAITDTKLVHSSGNAALDKAITIAIMETGNLGRPPDNEDLHLTFVVEQ